jgi:hypothetical protein
VLSGQSIDNIRELNHKALLRKYIFSPSSLYTIYVSKTLNLNNLYYTTLIAKNINLQIENNRQADE